MSRKVLVVEDVEALARVIMTTLDRKGHEARWAPSGAEALAAVEGWTPEVVLLDLHLGDADGLDIARKLRRRRETKKVRIVGISGDPVPAAKRRMLDDFLLKPVTPREILEATES